jgi:hypothetical protein
MITIANAGFKRAAIVLAAALLSLGAASSLGAQTKQDEMVRLRFQSEKESATVEVPMKILDFFDRHNVGKTVHTGVLNGQKVTLSLSKLVAALKENRGKSGETLLFSEEEHGKTVNCYTSFAPPSPRPGKAPVNVVLVVKDLKANDVKTKLTVPLSTVDAVMQALNIQGNEGDDLGGLFKQCVQFANELGTGLLAKVTGPSEEVLLSLE